MGHCEMLLAVAGLDNDAVTRRTQQLAGGDWAAFAAPERVAFGFAHKISREPSSITNQDVAALVDCYGAERALDIIWWTCRCHYMTRVADALQLPLERDNVFEGVSVTTGQKKSP